MILKKIITYPNKKLREQTVPVSFPLSTKTLSNITDAFLVLSSMDNAAAIASNQLGFEERFFVYKSPDGSTEVAINPLIWEKEEEKQMNEGCLSFPGLSMKVNRSNSICVSFWTMNGAKIDTTLTGHLAQVFQHETDHLNGRLFIDDLSSDEKETIARKMVER